MEPHSSWGYGAGSPAGPWAPVHRASIAPTGVKRPLSQSSCDDAYSEESSKEQCTNGDADSCQMMSRKKRRGVIEKKRRDRINTSLSELKRLVPSAYEKQGSAKLEKAEILQMTVDHLKMIHSKGLDCLAYDPHKFAMDYHNIGFRECASEVARYLVTIEGMDIQDPLRLRLISHLQCFAAQRELASKQSPAHHWSYPPPHPVVPVDALGTAGTVGAVGTASTASSGQSTAGTVSTAGHHHHLQQHQYHDVAAASSASIPTSAGTTTGAYTTAAQVPSTSASVLAPLATAPISYGAHYHHHHHQNGNGHNYGPGHAGSKPYRPWGAELAY